MALAKKQVFTELVVMRLRMDPRIHEPIQRLIDKDKEIITIIQQLLIDTVAGDPQVQPEIETIVIATIPLSPSGHGDFSVAHGLGVEPQAVAIEMTSAGLIWFQTTKYDDQYLYLVASEAGLTADAKIFY